MAIPDEKYAALPTDRFVGLMNTCQALFASLKKQPLGEAINAECTSAGTLSWRYTPPLGKATSSTRSAWL